MARIALIQDGAVENIIEADMEFALSLGFDAAVESASAGIGWAFDGVTFTPPPAEPQPEPTPEDRRITRLMFRNRFTQAEHVTIEIASLDDAAAPMQQRQMAAALRVMQRQVSDAEFIDLNDPVTRAGVQQLEAFGLLAEGRAAEILDGSLAPE